MPRPAGPWASSAGAAGRWRRWGPPGPRAGAGSAPGGGVGTLAAMGAAGLAVRGRFCAELGLADPGTSWLTARDRVAEAGSVLAMVCGTLARIGLEVYELQRPEIGELREPTRPDLVG